MEDRAYKCAFTGHREEKLGESWREDSPECMALKQHMLCAIENVYQSGIHYFLCGMAHGCDLYFAGPCWLFSGNTPMWNWKPLFPTPVRLTGGGAHCGGGMTLCCAPVRGVRCCSRNTHGTA